MDKTILLKNGIEPTNPRIGCLNDYALKIGNRASLIPCKHEKSWGIVMTVEKKAILDLYSEASVADYIPEEVDIITPKHESIRAICYNLPPESLSGTNASYAKSLYKLAKEQGFPADYLEKLEKMAKTKPNRK